LSHCYLIMDHGEEAVGDQNIEYDGENMFEMANMSQMLGNE